MLDEKAIVNELPHWNGGVVFFKKNQKVNNFFDLWYKYYKIHNNKYDQISLVEAIFRSECRILSLDSRWNYKRKNPNIPLKKNIKIVHYVTDMTSRNTPQIDKKIIKKILTASTIIPEGMQANYYSEVQDFFIKINNFRKKRILPYRIIKKLIKK